MAGRQVTVFRPFDFRLKQKLVIDGGPRKGDWEVIGLSERKVKLRCPVTNKEVEWDRFAYFVEERQQDEWPSRD